MYMPIYVFPCLCTGLFTCSCLYSYTHITCSCLCSRLHKHFTLEVLHGPDIRSCWIQTWGLCGFRHEAPGVFRYEVPWCVRARGSCGSRHEIPKVMVGLDMMSWKVKIWGSGELRDSVVVVSYIYIYKVLWFWWVQTWLYPTRTGGIVDVVYVNTVTLYVGCEDGRASKRVGHLLADQRQEWMGTRTTSKRSYSPSK
jgi:hypothetical protein